MENNKKENFSRFGKNFQESLIMLILRDRPFAEQIGEILEKDFFEVKFIKKYYEIILNYKAKYKAHPSIKIISSILTSMEDEDEMLMGQLRSFHAKILADGLNVEGEEYVKDIALEFCRKQTMKKAILEAVDLLKNENTSFDKIKKVIDEAVKLGTSNDFGHDFITDFEKRYEERQRRQISTGWPEIDEITDGGLGRGEFGIVIGSTGAGKSMNLVWLGSQCLKLGKTVVYYTLELSDLVVARRFDACITNTDQCDLNTFKENILEKVSQLPGRLIVKEYPTRSATVGTLRNHLNKMISKNIKPDMIIVDYIDILKPTNDRENKVDSLEEITQELRALATEFDCPLWSCTQGNRAGEQAEILTLKEIAGAYNKAFVADLVYSIARTLKDKDSGFANMAILKNRLGKDGVTFPAFINPSSVQIKVLNNEEYNETTKADMTKKKAEEVRERFKLHLEMSKKNSSNNGEK